MEWTVLGWLSYIALWIVVAIQAVLTLVLARLVGQLSRRNPPSGARVINPGPEIGELVRGWTGVDLLGQPVNIAFPRERGVLLLYVSPHCSVCGMLLPSAKRFFGEIKGKAEGVWVMVLGSHESQIHYARDHGLFQHAVVAEDQLPASWRVEGAPFGLWIDGSGKVKAKGMVNHREHLESLLHAADTGHASIQSYLTSLDEAPTSGATSAAQADGSIVTT